MDILVGDVNSRAVTNDAKALVAIRNVCRARPDGYQFMKKYKSGHWDGFVSLMPRFDAFPTGLLGIVVEELRRLDYHVKLNWGDVGYRRLNTVQEDSLFGITLRDYQLEATRKGLNSTRGIFKMATNTGKTAIIAAVLYALNLQEDETAVVIVNGVDLMYQVSKELTSMLGMEIGRLGDGHADEAAVTVSTIQSLSRIKALDKRFPNNVAVLIDECHHGSSDQYLKALQSLPGHYRYGFSGTPLNHGVLMDMRLIAMTGRVIYERTNTEQIEAGYSAKPIINMHNVYADDVNDWRLDYQSAYKKLVVENEVRNKLIAKLARECVGVMLIYVTRITHGLDLHALIPGSLFVNGKDDSDYRKYVLDLMRTDPGVYIATNIFDEGVDVPAINELIYAAAGKSERQVLQRLGRGLRQKDGDNVLIVHDFIDDTNKHLLRHSEERIDVYINEGFDVAEVDASDGKPIY